MEKRHWLQAKRSVIQNNEFTDNNLCDYKLFPLFLTSKNDLFVNFSKWSIKIFAEFCMFTKPYFQLFILLTLRIIPFAFSWQEATFYIPLIHSVFLFLLLASYINSCLHHNLLNVCNRFNSLIIIRVFRKNNLNPNFILPVSQKFHKII